MRRIHQDGDLPIGDARALADLDPLPASIEWAADRIRLVDQRLLPTELRIIDVRTVDELVDAITSLAIRGAPALGVAGAMGVALAQRNGDDLEDAAERLRRTRPTAVNLSWGIDQAVLADDPLAAALAIAEEDVARCLAIGRHGAALLGDDVQVLTHCNAGGLACVRYGTALGVIRAAHDAGKAVRVWVDETRPVLQGARLTAWELDRLGIDATLIADVAAASLMARGAVDAVVVGADRITSDGSVANKVGTYGLAVLARHHGIPMYVAAPVSTIDPTTSEGRSIVVEERDGDEVRMVAGRQVAPSTIAVANPAFDVTPPELITAYITDQGVIDGGTMRDA